MDRSFVDGLGDIPECNSLVSVALGLARSLGPEVVAKGTEADEQLAQIENLGCEFGQGYQFSKLPPWFELELFLTGPATWPKRSRLHPALRGCVV